MGCYNMYIKNKSYSTVSEFIAKNSEIEIILTNHVYDRLRDRMGWSKKYALGVFGEDRKINISLSNGIVEHAKGGNWKIHIVGFGKFVIVKKKNTDMWVAVTYYPAKI